MSSVIETRLLETGSVAVRDIECDGGCRHKSPVECATATAIVVPYRGLFVRHLGNDEAVGEANQALFFNEYQEYSISHPVAGGDACLSIAIADEILSEIVPSSRLANGPSIIFREQRARIDPAAQSIAARLRHGLRSESIDVLQAESMTLNLVRKVLRDGISPNSRISAGKRKLVDRSKLIIASEPGRRWTLAEIGEAAGCSPVYLTQLFQLVEGMPLYRYQLQQRLAKALDEIGQHDNLTMLALDLGFSSHSHFSAAFRSAFGLTPSTFRQLSRSERGRLPARSIR